MPKIFGDPASLLPHFFQPSRRSSRQKICLVPHYVDKYRFRDLARRDVDVVNVNSRDLLAEIRKIATAELVISSSLHGLIIAEAYGVPTVWVEPSERILGGHHKFLDYFEGSGRSRTPYPTSLGLNGLASRAEKPPKIDTEGLLGAAAQVVEALGDSI